MVGVPGRSKGCATCRRMKKGCDLKTPCCGQCERKGLKCGGYERDRIFINQNAAVAPSYSAHNALNLQLNGKNPIQLNTPSIVLPDALTRSAYREKSVEAFFNMYIPDAEVHRKGRLDVKTVTSTKALACLQVRDEALRLALVAVGTASLGKRTGDEWMIRQGREIYGKALQELTKALGNPERAHGESLIAVPRTLGLFEILFGATRQSNEQARSWRSHAEGELALLKNRGPEAFVDGMSHQLFVDGRIGPIIAAIRARRATVLGSVEWQTIPWRHKPKSPKDHVLDLLAIVPNILEILEWLAPEGTPERAEQISIALTQCKELHIKTEKFASVYEDYLYLPSTEDPIPIAFPDVATAYITVVHWTLCTWLYAAFNDLLGVPSDDSTTSNSDGRPHPRLFARRITRSVPYFFHKSLGIWGATTISFPLGTSMLYARRSQVDDEYKQIVLKAWMNPELPGSIRDFLSSMRREQINDRVRTGLL